MAAAITTASTTLEGQMLELATSLSNTENNTTNAPNNVSVTFNFDAETATISAVLPLSITLVSGKPTITAEVYL